MAVKPLSKGDIAEVREALGHRLVELREVANLSQTEASARAGLDRRNWIRIEKGESTPNLESLLQIQYMFGLDTLDSLFGPTTGDLLKIRPRSGQ
jgi:transcriptional regulator with XRE-family HTH domain